MPKQKLEEFFEPMLCVSGRESDLERPGYVGELKYDGTRCIAENTLEFGFQMFGQRGLTYDEILPELTEQLTKIPMLFRLDGEIVYIDPQGHVIFAGSQKRCQISNPEKIEEYRKAYPVGLMLFDIMMLNNADLRTMPYAKRRLILESFLKLNGEIYDLSRIRIVPSSFKTREMYEWAVANGFEGIVEKDVSSPYVKGESKFWVKIKTRDHTPWLLPDNGRL